DLPLPVERVLKELALFDWRPDWAWSNDEPRWGPFGIPIWLPTDDHLTVSHRGPRVDVSVLDMASSRHPVEVRRLLQPDPDTHLSLIKDTPGHRTVQRPNEAV